MLAAADAAAQLMQLADAEPVGIHHQHDRGVGDVDADLNDGGAHQHIDLARAKTRHHGVLLVGRQPPVHEPQPQVGQLAGTQSGVESFGGFRRPCEPSFSGSSLSSIRGATTYACRPAATSSMMRCQARSSHAGLSLMKIVLRGDRLASARKFAQRQGFQVAVDRERHRARYRCGRHHQQMRGDARRSLGAQSVSLLHTEPMLLVDHHHAQIVEFHRVLQQRVGADDDVDLARGDLGPQLFLLPCRHRAAEQRHSCGIVGPAQLAAHGQRAQNIGDRSHMLCGKHFRGRQQRALVARVDHLQHRQHRDDRLARPDLALQQPVQWAGRRESVAQHVEHLTLTRGQLERQAPQQFCRQSVRPRRCRGPRLGQLAVPSHQQRPLQADGFVEGQPLAGAPAYLLVLGEMDGAQRFVFGDEAMLGKQFRRQRIVHRIEDIEHLAHAGEDVPALHFGAGRIDRKEGAFEVLDRQLAAPGGLRGLGDVFQAAWSRGLCPSRIRNAGCVSCMAFL